MERENASAGARTVEMSEDERFVRERCRSSVAYEYNVFTQAHQVWIMSIKVAAEDTRDAAFSKARAAAFAWALGR